MESWEYGNRIPNIPILFSLADMAPQEMKLEILKEAGITPERMKAWLPSAVGRVPRHSTIHRRRGDIAKRATDILVELAESGREGAADQLRAAAESLQKHAGEISRLKDG